MQGQANSFAQHVAAAWSEGLSMGAYAKRHDLAPSTLYRWQQKLRLRQAAQGTQCSPVDAQMPADVYEQAAQPGGAEPAGPRPSVCEGKFVALHIAHPQSARTNASDKRQVSSERAAVRVTGQQRRHHAPSARLQTRPHPIGQPGGVAPGHTHDPNDLDDFDAPGHYTLILPGAIRMQMHAPPEPAWLIALSVCAQRVY